MEMDITSALEQMLLAIGAANDNIVAILQVEPGHWAVGYLDDTTIEVECQEGSNRLTLYTGIGTPNPGDLDRIRHTMLNYNLLWRETGGMRMGLSGPGDAAYLIGDVYLPETSEASLDQALFNMAQLGRIWTRFVTEGSLGPNGPAFDAEALIRV